MKHRPSSRRRRIVTSYEIHNHLSSHIFFDKTGFRLNSVCSCKLPKLPIQDVFIFITSSKRRSSRDIMEDKIQAKLSHGRLAFHQNEDPAVASTSEVNTSIRDLMSTKRVSRRELLKEKLRSKKSLTLAPISDDIDKPIQAFNKNGDPAVASSPEVNTSRHDLMSTKRISRRDLLQEKLKSKKSLAMSPISDDIDKPIHIRSDRKSNLTKENDERGSARESSSNGRRGPTRTKRRDLLAEKLERKKSLLGVVHTDDISSAKTRMKRILPKVADENCSSWSRLDDVLQNAELISLYDQ